MRPSTSAKMLTLFVIPNNCNNLTDFILDFRFPVVPSFLLGPGRAMGKSSCLSDKRRQHTTQNARKSTYFYGCFWLSDDGTIGFAKGKLS